MAIGLILRYQILDATEICVDYPATLLRFQVYRTASFEYADPMISSVDLGAICQMKALSQRPFDVPPARMT